MAQRRNIYVNRGSRKPNAIVPALVVVLVALLTAFVGAYAWQGIGGDDVKYEEKQKMLQMARSQAAGAAASASEAASSQSSASQGAASSSTPESSAASTAETVAAQKSPVVAQSGRVMSTYFDDAIFVGDSITDGILSYELMKNATVIAHTGINPDSIRTKAVYRDGGGGLVTMLQAMSHHASAKKIYIMLGANSASWMDRDLFLQYYEEFVLSVVKQHPNATIYVQSITPINEAKFKTHYAGQDLTNAKIASLNEDLIKMAGKLQVSYVNVNEALRGTDGQLPDEATSDGLHFNTTYYQKWFDYLKTHTVPSAVGGASAQTEPAGSASSQASSASSAAPKVQPAAGAASSQPAPSASSQAQAASSSASSQPAPSASSQAQSAASEASSQAQSAPDEDSEFVAGEEI